MSILFITNFCAHYRVKTFETLDKKMVVDFLFFSDGRERYWDRRHGLRLGDFHGEYLEGFTALGVRVTPRLVLKLLVGGYDAVVKCITGRFALPVTYVLTRLRRKPFVLWANLWYHPRSPFHHVSRPLVRWIYTHSDAIVAAGSHVATFLISEGVNREKVFISRQAVDPGLFAREVSRSEIEELRRSLRLNNSKVVLYVGRFDPLKGLDYLLHGFESLSSKLDAILVMVGEGEEKPHITAAIREKGLEEKVVLRGYVDNVLLPTYYALANVLVLPSVTTNGKKEVWGLVVNEAMNQGCPVVATDAVGAVAGGLVRNGETGYVVPERDGGEIGNALYRILSNSSVEERMRAAGRDEIRLWTYERQVDAFVKAVEYASGGRG